MPIARLHRMADRQSASHGRSPDCIARLRLAAVQLLYKAVLTGRLKPLNRRFCGCVMAGGCRTFN